MPKKTELNHVQERAIEALLCCDTLEEVAKTAGCGARTLYTWLKAPEFRDRLRQAQNEALRGSIRHLGRGAELAARVLIGIASDEEAALGPRVQACKTLLDCGMRWLEAQGLEERLASLEKRLFGEVSKDAA